MTIDWGSVPDWFAGTGAVIALLWARKAAKAASNTDRLQGKQLEMLEEEKRRSQAEKIAAWVSDSSVIRIGEPLKLKQVLLRNASDLPVYMVTVILSWKDGPVHAQWVDVLPPTQSPEPMRISDPIVEQNFVDFGSWMVSITFRDATGAYWFRIADGTLLPTTYDNVDRVINDTSEKIPELRAALAESVQSER